MTERITLAGDSLTMQKTSVRPQRDGAPRPLLAASEGKAEVYVLYQEWLAVSSCQRRWLGLKRAMPAQGSLRDGVMGIGGGSSHIGAEVASTRHYRARIHRRNGLARMIFLRVSFRRSASLKRT